jgi:DNA-binding transcriptional MerR regulator
MVYNGSHRNMDQKLPDKLTFKRKEVIQLAKLDGKVLDYWEREFGGFAVMANSSGEQFYSRPDVELILKIKQLLLVDKIGKKRLKEVIDGSGTSSHRKKTVAAGSDHSELGEENKELIKSRLQEILTILDKNDTN